MLSQETMIIDFQIIMSSQIVSVFSIFTVPFALNLQNSEHILPIER